MPSSSRNVASRAPSCLVGEVEDVPDLDRGFESEHAAALGAAIALDHLAKIGEACVVVASRLDASEVETVLVRAGDELPLAKGQVGDYLALEPDRAERAARRSECRADLLVRRRAGAHLSAESSFDSDSRSSPRMSASTTRPSSVVTGMALEVAVGSMREARRAPRSSSRPASRSHGARRATPGTPRGPECRTRPRASAA